jgi:hypothetical protein
LRNVAGDASKQLISRAGPTDGKRYKK